jgi:hypothetical protein
MSSYKVNCREAAGHYPNVRPRKLSNAARNETIAANLPIGELGTLFIGVCMKNSMVENAKVS